MSVPANFEARRLEDEHQRYHLARWCGGLVIPDGITSADLKVTAHFGDWIIKAADGSVCVDPPGNQTGYCADCGEPVWWHDVQLITRSGIRWCYGPGGTRLAMDRWHALPGTHQYIVPAAEGQPCHCLDRSWPHIHVIVPVPVLPEASCPDTCGECTGGLIAAGVRCNCDPGPEGQHKSLCGFIPCPNGCWERLNPQPEPVSPGSGH